MAEQLTAQVMDLTARVDELETFEAYDEYQAWNAAISAGLALPALRAFWPMSSVDYAAASQARDVAGGGYHLTNNNSADFRYRGLVPCVDLFGTNEYLSRADGGATNWADITGAETYILGAQQGLTMGGWFWFDDSPPPAAAEYLMAKRSGAAGNYSYWLVRGSTSGYGRFWISDDGTNTSSVTSTDVLDDGQWWFIAGRFDPGSAVDIFVNGTWDTAVTARASLYDGTAAFTIGSHGGGGGYLDGNASLCWLCAAYLSDAIVGAFYAQTRALFGV